MPRTIPVESEIVWHADMLHCVATGSSREYFNVLVSRWQAERDPTEMTIRAVRHPAYRAIVDMKWLAVPFLLEELEREPDDWFSALAEITQEYPYGSEDLGRFDRKAKAWLDWGRKNGIID